MFLSLTKFILLTQLSGVHYAPDWITEKVRRLENANGMSDHTLVLYREGFESTEIQPYINTMIVSYGTIATCGLGTDCIDGVLAHELAHKLSYHPDSKTNEHLADINAVLMLNNAGLDSCALGEYFSNKEYKDYPSLTHPLDTDRITVINNLCKNLPKPTKDDQSNGNE